LNTILGCPPLKQDSIPEFIDTLQSYLKHLGS
jgi:hypothetical protein